MESVVIPDSVETIGIYAFGHCTELKEVIIGNKVKTLGKGCFENTGLTSVVIPESVETIGIRAFWGCTKLSAVTLNSGLLTIGLSAFHGCGLISSIVIPSSVVEIRNRAFEDCTALKIIYVPESVKMLGYDIFYNTDNITIYGVAGSEAEDYAKQYSILFVNGRIPETNPIDEGWKQDKTGWWY